MRDEFDTHPLTDVQETILKMVRDCPGLTKEQITAQFHIRGEAYLSIGYLMNIGLIHADTKTDGIYPEAL